MESIPRVPSVNPLTLSPQLHRHLVKELASKKHEVLAFDPARDLTPHKVRE